MGVNRVYRKEDERATASFNYIDIANGTGVRTFWVLDEADGVGINPFMSQSADYGKAEVIATETDVDADLTPFNLPQTVKGTATINFYGRMAGGSTTFFTVTMYHYDGSTETAISSAITSQSISGDEQILLQIPLTQKHFKKGDILRVRLQHTGIDSSAYYISASKPIKLNIPFRIDI